MALEKGRCLTDLCPPGCLAQVGACKHRRKGQVRLEGEAVVQLDEQDTQTPEGQKWFIHSAIGDLAHSVC